MKKICSFLLCIFSIAVLTSCSSETGKPQVTYTDQGLTCIIEGYDAKQLVWNYVEPKLEFLYFDKPDFLGPAFQDGNHYWGNVALEDDVIEVSVTADTIGDPTCLGPTRIFSVDADGEIVDDTVTEGCISLTDEEMVQTAQTFRQIIEDVQTYVAAHKE